MTHIEHHTTTVDGLATGYLEAGSGDPVILLHGGEFGASAEIGWERTIPALAAHYIFDGIIEKVRATMKDVSVQILSLEDEFRRNERMRAVEEARRVEQDRRVQAEQEQESASLRRRSAPVELARSASSARTSGSVSLRVSPSGASSPSAPSTRFCCGG